MKIVETNISEELINKRCNNEELICRDLFTKEKITISKIENTELVVGTCVPKDLFCIVKDEDILSKREIYIYNIGETGVIEVDNQEFVIDNQETLCVPVGTKRLSFSGTNARYFIVSEISETTKKTKLFAKNEQVQYEGTITIDTLKLDSEKKELSDSKMNLCLFVTSLSTSGNVELINKEKQGIILSVSNEDLVYKPKDYFANVSSEISGYWVLVTIE